MARSCWVASSAIISSHAGRETTLPCAMSSMSVAASRGVVEPRPYSFSSSGQDVGVAVAEGRPVEARLRQAERVEERVHVGRADHPDEEVRGRVVAVRDHELQEIRDRQHAFRRGACSSGIVSSPALSDVVEGDRRVLAELARRHLAVDLGHDGDLDQARGRKPLVGVDRDDLARVEVLRVEAHLAREGSDLRGDRRFERASGRCGDGGCEERGGDHRAPMLSRPASAR